MSPSSFLSSQLQWNATAALTLVKLSGILDEEYGADQVPLLLMDETEYDTLLSTQVHTVSNFGQLEKRWTLS